MKYEEKILTYLVDMYRKSKKDSGNNKINRRTQVKPEKFYKQYSANDGDFHEISKLNQTIDTLTEKGFIYYDTETFGTQIQCMYLVDEKVIEIEAYLSRKYGYISKDMQIEKIRQLVEKYCDASPICKKECSELQSFIQYRKVPKNYRELEDVYKAVAFLENNTEDLFIREVSLRVYGNSKYFESKVLQSVCSLLHKYDDDRWQDGRLFDEILNRYHVYREPQKLCIKGNVIINISDNIVPVKAFSDGIEVMATELANIQSVKIMGDVFMTIENRTSYLRYKEKDTVSFYLGGYANRNQRDFIKMIYRDNPEVTYMHFGDIDAGGFWIHHNLCEITGINFQMFGMSTQELQNKKYIACLQELTENDITRLEQLCEMFPYRDVVSYMLENHVKLEQEIVSLCLMEDEDEN